MDAMQAPAVMQIEAVKLSEPETAASPKEDLPEVVSNSSPIMHPLDADTSTTATTTKQQATKPYQLAKNHLAKLRTKKTRLDPTLDDSTSADALVLDCANDLALQECSKDKEEQSKEEEEELGIPAKANQAKAKLNALRERMRSR